VLDLGGDPAGAKVMASIAEGMRPEDYSGLFVLNSRRPFTATVEAAKRMMDGISSAAKIGVDRIVVNSHLIDETTPAVIEEGIALGEELSRATGAAIAFVAVQREMLERFDAAGCRYPVMVLERLMLKPWEPAHRPAEANTANWLGKYRIQ
jgi:molybdenum cofactor biosynthesis enzyme MoaA